jgi:4-amino-4-deoxy-L-arabinose transferase-like glycosyltransferase
MFFGAVILLAVVLRLVCYNGLIGGGDIVVVESAIAVNNGIWPVEPHPFLTKFGFLLPYVLSLKLFGPAEWAQMSIPFLASMGCIALAFFVGWRIFGLSGKREYGDIAGFLAGLIVAVNPLDIIMATWIRWEALFAFWTAFGIGFLYLTYRERQFPFLLLSAIGTGCAYFTHNWGALLLIFGTFALLTLAIARKAPIYFIPVWLVIISLFVIGEFIGFNALNGDPFFAWRFSLEPGVSRLTSLADLSARLGRRFAGLAFWELKGISATLIVGIASVILLLKQKQRHFLLLVGWAAVILLWADFGSTRITVYDPFILTAKPLLPALFPLAIIVSGAFTRLIVEPNREHSLRDWTWAMAIAIFLAFMATDAARGNFVISLTIITLLLFIPVLLLGLVRRVKTDDHDLSAVLGNMGVVALTIVLITVPTIYLKFNRVDWVGNERAIIEYCRKNHIERIYTDGMTKRTIDYIVNYKYDIKIVDYEIRDAPPQPGDIYVINRYKIWRTRFRNRPEPTFFNDLENWEGLYIIDNRSPKPAEMYRVR